MIDEQISLNGVIKIEDVQDCNRGFYNQHDYDYHVRIHTGERPFKCNYNGCDHSSVSKSSLRIHIERIHERK